MRNVDAIEKKGEEHMQYRPLLNWNNCLPDIRRLPENHTEYAIEVSVQEMLGITISSSFPLHSPIPTGEISPLKDTNMYM
jgi:hypothetical protein